MNWEQSRIDDDWLVRAIRLEHEQIELSTGVTIVDKECYSVEEREQYQSLKGSLRVYKRR